MQRCSPCLFLLLIPLSFSSFPFPFSLSLSHPPSSFFSSSSSSSNNTLDTLPHSHPHCHSQSTFTLPAASPSAPQPLFSDFIYHPPLFRKVTQANQSLLSPYLSLSRNSDLSHYEPVKVARRCHRCRYLWTRRRYVIVTLGRLSTTLPFFPFTLPYMYALYTSSCPFCLCTILDMKTMVALQTACACVGMLGCLFVFFCLSYTSPRAIQTFLLGAGHRSRG